MIILAVESSCDETGVALLENTKKNSPKILSNIIASSLALHGKTGGIIPEVAAREQVRYMNPTITQALKLGLNYDFKSKIPPPVDAIAVTYGPGLIGSLLVGVETAKTLSLLWDKPLIPVNHMHGHLYANWIDSKSQILFPAVVLIVSGGHTDLLLMKDHNDISVIGGTRDDAAGEAFDKIGRLLNIPYPAGATIAKRAEKGDPKSFALPRPMWDSKDYDFSFSGLKTAVLREVQTIKELDDMIVANLCASVEQAIVDILVKKTIQAAKEYNVKSILLGGGVAANTKLQKELKKSAISHKLTAKIFVPQKFLCTDNAAMIAAAAFFTPPAHSWKEVNANPQLYY